MDYEGWQKAPFRIISDESDAPSFGIFANILPEIYSIHVIHVGKYSQPGAFSMMMIFPSLQLQGWGLLGYKGASAPSSPKGNPTHTRKDTPAKMNESGTISKGNFILSLLLFMGCVRFQGGYTCQTPVKKNILASSRFLVVTTQSSWSPQRFWR